MMRHKHIAKSSRWIDDQSLRMGIGSEKDPRTRGQSAKRPQTSRQNQNARTPDDRPPSRISGNNKQPRRRPNTQPEANIPDQRPEGRTGGNPAVFVHRRKVENH